MQIYFQSTDQKSVSLPQYLAESIVNTYTYLDTLFSNGVEDIVEART